MAVPLDRPDHGAMQIIGATGAPDPRRAVHLVGAAAGTILVVSGLTLWFATLMTPFVDLISVGRFGSATALNGLLVRWLAVALGAVFLGVGVARLADVLAHVRSWAATVLPAMLPISADGPVMALDVSLGDGRPIPKLVVGRFGAAVLRDLPSPTIARQQGAYWEGLTDQGWIRIESPLDRAARDAERVRRWLADDDRDYVVRVYAAVVGTEPGIARTPTCAVITESQVEPWLASLPVQRSLNEGRRNQLIALLQRR